VTRDCSGKISGEHYVSAGVLKEIDHTVELDGFPWIPKGEKKRIPIYGLTANILCDRHNKALSPLDSLGMQFFRAVKQYSVAPYDGRERVSAFNGRDVERWMLKTLYGLLASENLQVQYGTRIRTEIDMECAEDLYDKAAFPPTRGLFVPSKTGHTVATKQEISFSPVTDNVRRKLIGLQVTIMGFDFLLATSPVTAEDSTYRPGYIVFSSHTGEKVIHLFWKDAEPHPIVYFVNR
jgi:hypothetical protein